MNRRTIWVAAAVLAGVVVAGVYSLDARAQQPSVATHRVVIYDNGGSLPGANGDPATGQWTYAPNHIQVTKGETIEFVNPAGNARPHTVTSITISGQPPNRMLIHGAAFDSSPNTMTLLQPGSSWTLDTSTLEAPSGQYTYYCWLHPWMVGSFTVVPAP